MIKEILLNKILLERFVKFCVVGGSGVFVDFGITYVAKEWLRLNKYVANSLGFACAATSNYILNRIWTFSSTDPHITQQYLRFMGFSLIGLAINNSIVYLLHGRRGWNFYWVKLLATAAVTLWNFSINYLFTFQ